jgi:Tfp pilus assembly protein PilF
MDLEEEARALLGELLQLAERRYVFPALLAEVFAVLGDRDSAFRYYEQALDERSLVASWLRNPLIEGIRDDARYQGLFGRLGLSV